jgi:hypothetical protein
MASVKSTVFKPHWFRWAGLGLGILTGGFWLFFTVASHGASLASVIEVASVGGAILVFTAVAWRWQIVGGALLLLLGLIFAGMMTDWGQQPNSILVVATLPAPIMIAGILLLIAECRHEGDR